MLRRVLPVVLLLACAPAFAQGSKTMQDAEAAYRANDFATAVSILQTLAADGSAQAQHRETAAQYLLGRFLLEGIGVERNPAEAAKSLLKAAAKGNAQAQLLIGR